MYTKDHDVILHHFLPQIASMTSSSCLVTLANELESLVQGSAQPRYPDRWLPPSIPHDHYDEEVANKALVLAKEIVNEVGKIINNCEN